MTKDRTGSVTSVLRTELHIKRTDLHMHFGKQTSVSGRMCVDCIITNYYNMASLAIIILCYSDAG